MKSIENGTYFTLNQGLCFEAMIACNHGNAFIEFGGFVKMRDKKKILKATAFDSCDLF